MKYFITLMFIFLIGCSTSPYVYEEINTPGLSAAMEASNKYNPLSIDSDAEYGGVIYKDRVGDYGYTVYKGKKGTGKVTFSLTIPEKTIRVAFWHTHGGYGALNKYYSRTDSEVVNKYKVPYYMADYTGTLWLLPVKHIKTSRTKGIHVGDLEQ